MRVGVINFISGEYGPGDPGELIGERNRDDAEGLLLAELDTRKSRLFNMAIVLMSA